MFEQLPDIHVASSKHNPILPVNISNINATKNNVVQKKDIQNTNILLSLSSKELINRQNSYIFCLTILKSVDDKKMSPDRNFFK